MATPVLRALRHRYSDSSIDVLTGPWSAPALAGNPRVAMVLDYPAHVTPTTLLRLARELRQRRYDLAVGLDRSPVVNALLWLAGIPERAGIDNQGRGVGLSRRVSPQAGQHETDLFLAVAEAAGAPACGVEPDYEVDDAQRERMAAMVPPGRGPLVVIHPGGAVNPGATMLAKRWPSDRFATLAASLVRDVGCRIVLVGAETDREAVRHVLAEARSPLTDLSGRLDLPPLAALISLADVYVGNDSGASHLAAAVGTPTVTIFGPTSPRRYRPRGPGARVCAPAASWDLPDDVDLRGGASTAGAADIAAVSVEEVLAATREILAGAGVGTER